MTQKTKEPRPSRLCKWLIKRIFRDEGEAKLGDFMEIYSTFAEEKGRIQAKVQFWGYLIRSIPEYLKDTSCIGATMFKNYIKIALRNISRHKIYSLINVTGLVAGLTCCICILLFVQYEFSYDKFHEDAGNIYRVLTKFSKPGPSGSNLFPATPSSLGPAIKENFPEVKKSTRLKKRTGLVRLKEKSLDNQIFYYADQEFLDIFDFPLISGNENIALSLPYSVVLTQETADLLFGGTNPIGQTITFDYRAGLSHDYVISGVLKKLPQNSHLSFNYLASFSTLKDFLSIDWSNLAFVTYVELHKNHDPEGLQNKFGGFLSKHVGPDYGYNFELQPLTKIHLFSSFDIFSSRKADIKTIYIFSVIGFLIMAVVCFNYMNLSTALSVNRTNEIGVRKIIGARRTQIIKQIWGESLLFTLISFCIALFLIKILLPIFGAYVDRELSFSLLENLKTLFYVIGLMIFVGLVSGSYPALFLTSFEPVNIIKGKLTLRSKHSIFFRNSLVFIQFAISIILIISVTIMLNQMSFMKNKDLGYDRKNIISLEVKDEKLLKNYDPFKNEIIQFPNIVDVTASFDLPTGIGSAASPFWEGQQEGEKVTMERLYVDYNFLEFYGIACIEGRNFMKESGTDAEEGFIINETAAKLIGWEYSTGKRFGYGKKEGQIIGVVKDFHFASLHNRIGPLSIEINPYGHRYLSIKTSTDDIKNTLAYIKNKWKEFSPGFPFSYSFIDDIVAEQYGSEEKLFTAIKSSTFLAIFFSCIGLGGLVSFSARSKTKEIGIRKVLGASSIWIITMFSKHFVKWVVFACFVASPIAYFFMQRWLQNFAYRINIGIWIFIGSITLTLFIVLLTICFQTIKAATANPVDSLRYE
jgi:putative ABC transport system permease protein